jgi:7-cyano-7-deazaguanine synthase in queuosine biosynthesis
LEGRGITPNVRIGLPKFVRGVYHLPERLLDLLEIACYVFAADRNISRGSNDAVEFHSWSRDLRFDIRVREHGFWNQQKVKDLLSESLSYMTGDANYSFNFRSGHSTGQADFFDSEEFHITVDKPTRIVLFSGGLDSLSGALSILKETCDNVCLVSHRSGQPETSKTQKSLADALKARFPDRVRHYSFESGLKGRRSVEETQRSRAFLFSSIAFALSHAFQQKEIYIYENGVTSMNVPRREDMINARSSRTTHPKTIGLLESLFSLINEERFEIHSPFFFKTKSDILTNLKTVGGADLLTSSVSCSKTFQHFESSTHCGLCYQCTDRRFAIYSAGLVNLDNRGLYHEDFITDSIKTVEGKIGIIDYVRQASQFCKLSLDAFADKYARELIDIVDYVKGGNDSEKIETLWNLCKRHGQQVFDAIKTMRSIHDNPNEHVQKDSLLKLVDEREYLKPDLERLTSSIITMIKRSVPIMFRNNPPANENDFNDKLDGILNAEKDQFIREFPGIPFALTKSIPDHSDYDQQLLIESKYPKEKSRLSKITDEMAADLVKYPKTSNILFVVYDPHRTIHNDQKFSSDFENKDTRCKVTVVR